MENSKPRLDRKSVADAILDQQREEFDTQHPGLRDLVRKEVAKNLSSGSGSSGATANNQDKKRK